MVDGVEAPLLSALPQAYVNPGSDVSDGFLSSEHSDPEELKRQAELIRSEEMSDAEMSQRRQKIRELIEVMKQVGAAHKSTRSSLGE
jgi:hypothetical protein